MGTVEYHREPETDYPLRHPPELEGENRTKDIAREKETEEGAVDRIQENIRHLLEREGCVPKERKEELLRRAIEAAAEHHRINPQTLSAVCTGETAGARDVVRWNWIKEEHTDFQEHFFAALEEAHSTFLASLKREEETLEHAAAENAEAALDQYVASSAHEENSTPDREPEQGEEDKTANALRQEIEERLRENTTEYLPLLSQAVEQVERRLRLPAHSLEQIVKSPAETPTGAQEEIAEPLQEIFELFSQFIEAEKRDRDIYRKPTEKIMEEANVSEEQRRQWEQLRTLDIPRETKVKIVAVSGGEGLNMAGEIPLIRRAFSAKLSTAPTIVEIDNLQPVADVKKQLREASSSYGFDYVLYYFSSHGISDSGYKLRNVDAPDDRFALLGGNEQELEDARTTARLAFDAVKKRLEAKNEQRVKKGETVTVGDRTITFAYDIEGINDIYGYLQLMCFPRITVADLKEARKPASDVHAEKQPKVVYFFDACHSGSSVGEGLMDDPTTAAVLASSAAEEKSYEENARGHYMHHVFQFLSQGATLGGGAVGADDLCNRKGPTQQDPKAEMRLPDGEILKVSSMMHQRKPLDPALATEEMIA